MSDPRTMEQMITDIIQEIGIPAHRKGYYYVREAIILVIENEDFKETFTQRVYKLIADKHGTAPRRVQRAIYYCIGSACSRGNTPFINRLFGLSRYSCRSPASCRSSTPRGRSDKNSQVRSSPTGKGRHYQSHPGGGSQKC